MGRHQKEQHEQPAHYLKNVRSIKPHLCSLAYDGGRKYGRMHPEQCAKCVSPCCYGMKLIQLLREEGKTFQGDAQYKTGELREIARSGPAELSMKRVLRRQARGKR